MTSNMWILPIAFVVYAGAWAIDEVTPKGPTQASLKSLTFQDGQFHQEFYVTGGGFIDMQWAAEINRDGVQLCSGGGRAPYRDQMPKQFSPDDWTFDECPPLRPGDEAFAVWSYTDETGLQVRFEGVLVLTEQKLRS